MTGAVLASVLDICNLALARLGDDAAVTSLYPPDGSPQALHCARFYPIALRFMLDMHSWNFAVTRVAPVLLATPPLSGWRYAFGHPADSISLIALYPSGAADDHGPVEFDLEILPDKTGVIYTNEPSPVVKYVAYVDNPGTFSPLFVDALVWLLASHLAGPILKGESGIKISQQCMGMFQRVAAAAMADDANQRKASPAHRVPWLSGREPNSPASASVQNPWTVPSGDFSIL